MTSQSAMADPLTSDISQQQPPGNDVIANQCNVTADRMTSPADDEWKQSASSFTSSQCSFDTVKNIAVTSQSAEPSQVTCLTVDGHVTQDENTTAEISENQPGSRDTVDDIRDAENQPTSRDSEQLQPEVVVPQQLADFKTGVTSQPCNDAPTALDILNTHYRLVDVTVHKNMITWSSWNVADIVRGPHRESCWWHARRPQNTDVTHDTQGTGTDDVTVSTGTQRDIQELSRRIDLKDREIECLLQKINAQAQQQPSTNHNPADDVITPEVQQVTCAERPAGGGGGGGGAGCEETSKRQNLLQRLFAAVRRRFTRTHSHHTTPSHTPTPTHRQRTL
jgi:hypothetical protein